MDLREYAMKLVAMAAVRKQAAALEKELREDPPELKSGDRVAAYAGETPIGTVTRNKDGWEVRVEDEDEFLTWMIVNHPEEIIQSIRPAYRKLLFEHMRKVGAPCTPEGEVVDGVEVVSKPGALTVRPNDDALETLRESGALQRPDTWGEIAGPRQGIE